MKFIAKPLVETADISRGKQTAKSFFKGVLSAVLVLTALYLLLGLVGELLARTIPDSWERKLGGVVPMAVLGKTNDVERAERILAKLTADESLRTLNYRLFILELDEPNAVAVPGGGIGITRELLKEVQSDPGLAFVLAHELGHHQHRDILRSTGRGLILAVAGALLFNYDGMPAVNSAYRLAETRHSRSQEQAADDFALRLVHKKFGTSSDALEFFEKLQAKRHEPFWQKYAGSHPLTAERLEYLKTVASQLDRSEL